ncbi:MAG: glucose-6-phosphate isomerase, partial [Oscillospiraceae bacterium]
MLSLDTGYLSDWVDCLELSKKADIIKSIHTLIHEGTGVGSEFLGWRDLPMNYDKQEYSRIKTAALRIRQNSQVLLVIGAGGSFLGAKAAIEFLHTPLYNQLNTNGFEIYFVGHNLSTSYLSSVITLLGNRDFSINVISKSGTTSEPAIAFRFFRELAEKKYGKDGAAKRIYCTTDKSRGA